MRAQPTRSSASNKKAPSFGSPSLEILYDVSGPAPLPKLRRWPKPRVRATENANVTRSAVTAGTRRRLSGRRAPWDQRPRYCARAIDGSEMQALGQWRVVMLLELIEGWVERTERMTKDAVGRLAWRRRAGGADVMGALIVRDRQ